MQAFTDFTEFTDKAISQNVRLLGCVCKTCKTNLYHTLLSLSKVGPGH